MLHTFWVIPAQEGRTYPKKHVVNGCYDDMKSVGALCYGKDWRAHTHTHTQRKGFSKNRSWTSSLRMKSKILADWKMALDELLKSSSIWQSCGLELMNQETPSTFSFLKLLFVFIHKVCLNCLPWGADWGAGSGFQSHISCERLCLLLHLSIASWSSHKARILDQRVNYGTVVIIVAMELGFAFIDVMRSNSKEKGVPNPAGQYKLFHVGPIFSIPLCFFLVEPATVLYKTYKCPYWHPQDLFSDSFLSIYGQYWATPLLPFEQTSKYLLMK